jgi:hypothetical protein
MPREHLFNVRVSTEEREKLDALAGDEGESASILVRRWIRQHYAARFGDVAPTAIKHPARKGA